MATIQVNGFPQPTADVKTSKSRGPWQSWNIYGLAPQTLVSNASIGAGLTGSTISGLLDALSITASLGLQSGVQVETLVEKWGRMSFEPSGTTGDPDLPRVSSIVDAVARWLRARYCPAQTGE